MEQISNSSDPKDAEKSKFLEALSKKKGNRNSVEKPRESKSPVKGSEAVNPSTRLHRRKTGPS